MMAEDKDKKTFDHVPSANIRRSPRVETLDYSAVLADLEGRKAAIERAIASLRAVMASGVLIGRVAGDSASVSFGVHGGDVPVGAFLGKSIPEAAKLCLQIVKRKLTSREIADYLKKGGIESSSKNFPIQVHSILTRAAKPSTSQLLKLDRSYWGLADWYPAGMRSSAPTEKRGNDKKRGRKFKTSEPKSKVASQKATEGTQDRILHELKANPGKEFAPADLAATLGVRVQTVHFLLGKLAYKKQAERTEGGKYKAIAA
jgi:hypothetical protein